MRFFDERWRRRRFIRPNALFLGIACSFLACCLAGRAGSHHNLYQDFERFHVYLNPSSYYYPTASQVYALGRAKLPTDKIAVVVGGNSILYGVGQNQPDVWTRKLQAHLGDDYRVIDLGMWGSSAHEFGAIAAEMLSGDYPRLILVTDTEIAGYPRVPDGVVHPYFFWDAYSKGLILHDAEREEALAQVPADRPGCTPLKEIKTKAYLNSWFWFDDMWTAVTYSYVGTVWNRVMPDFWYRPRCKLPDVEQQTVPFEHRYPADLLKREMETVRGYLAYGGCRKDSAGHWVEDPSSLTWKTLQDAARPCFPEPLRKRTMIVVTTASPHYVDRLAPDDRSRYFALSRLTAEKLEGAGFAALDMGHDFTVQDFNDRCHLAASGGARLAVKVADRVRRLAADLGYTRSEEGEEP